MQGPHVFQIGFSRCGTTSLWRLFADSGVPAIHWDDGNIGLNFERRKAAGEPPFADYPGIRYIGDMGNSMVGRLIEPYKDFRYIYEHHPDAYFILNVRDVQKWLLSRCNHAYLIQWHQQILGIDTLEKLLLHWTLDWSRHVEDVKQFFSDKPGRLLVFNIERDDPKAIADFVAEDFSIDPAFYRRSNESPTFRRYAKLPPYLLQRRGPAPF